MEETVNEYLTAKQLGRVEALKAARLVLSEKTSGAFSSSTKAVDVFDLVTIAEWIVDGKGPWQSEELKPKVVYDD